jgi:Predicted nucleotide kinase (related to CMP and AMP kinases)
VRVAVTGTPGTGKTTATDRLATDLEVVHLNEVIREEGLASGTDETRESVVADLDAVAAYLQGQDDIVVESHLAHHFDVDRVVVLRCHPETIEARLLDRDESPDSAAENAESEALDVILSEAVTKHGQDAVYEIEMTEQTPDATARAIEAVIAGEREPSAGTVDYTDYL